MIINQHNRKNPQRPTVSPGMTTSGVWWVQGVDPNGKYHANMAYSLTEAHTIATGWATNGYPKKHAA